ncbi:hypothetical protein CS0771_56040 [Catellatospora sp. IY07-71]|uniref:toll/interleukin-1 receptor domain-containing protein n=1 Tax=Catellatospora sp. IY07-71 TaxID=2728827 RepID=UPI001BB30FFE|nr:toll/interleukin-1 receptor domain-containing protein [Catellatospora sp. IY07-71]BCJ76060.1 hypothetical protein CS0771_56040 [Catellatospora sp. IY07-71]
MSGPVFISFSREHDAAYVTRLAGHLAAAGVYTVHDGQQMSDSRWDFYTRQQIDSCAAVLLVMTPEANGSPWVARELSRAHEQRKPVVALLLRGVPFKGVTEFATVTEGAMPGPDLATRLHKAAGLPHEPVHPDEPSRPDEPVQPHEPVRPEVAAWVPLRGGALAHAVGIEVRGGLFIPVLASGSRVPCARREVFTTAQDGQPSIKVTVYQGTGAVTAENQLIGAYDLLVSPAPSGVPAIDVTFQVDERGRFTLLAHDADGRDVPVVLLLDGGPHGR